MLWILMVCGITAGWMLEPVMAGKGKGGRNKPATPTENTYTDLTTAAEAVFYQIELQ